MGRVSLEPAHVHDHQTQQAWFNHTLAECPVLPLLSWLTLLLRSVGLFLGTAVPSYPVPRRVMLVCLAFSVEVRRNSFVFVSSLSAKGSSGRCSDRPNGCLAHTTSKFLCKMSSCCSNACTPCWQAWYLYRREQWRYRSCEDLVFFLLQLFASRTSRFPSAMACDGIDNERVPFGSRRPFLGCRYLRSAITHEEPGTAPTWRVKDFQLTVINFRGCYFSNFSIFNFRGLGPSRKFLNNENVSKNISILAKRSLTGSVSPTFQFKAPRWPPFFEYAN